jgi:predicted transcriptional regulator
MANELPSHPLRKWREARGYSAADVSALLKSRGFEFKKRTITAVEDGWRRPAYDVCEALESITGKAVTIAELRHWPLRESPPAKKKHAA